MVLPEKFKERMKNLLGDEYGAFLSALEEDGNVRGLRINTQKTDAENFLRKTTLPLLEIPYCKNGFILDSDSPVGNLAEHHAGLIYMQDPGAMGSLSAFDIPRGASVIDLCAAPGGKSGQAAEMIGEEGFLLSNEYVPKRAKILVGNFERLGIRNAVVTSLDTSEFPKLFSDYFDVAIADVPCSGEGMFRKNGEAISEWSEENVRASAERGRLILENAHSIVKPGGYIVFSTCTWSTEENEEVVLDFIKRHPNFELTPVKDALRLATSDGVCIPGDGERILTLCRRTYPHKTRGEGQFVALLQRKDEDARPRVTFSEKNATPTRNEMKTIEEFFKKYLISPPSASLIKRGENIYLIPNSPFPIPKSSVFMSGVLLGEIRRDVLIPSHQFFSSYGTLFKEREELSGDPVRLYKYLSGEEIDGAEATGGWCAVTFMGAPIGGGKAVSGRIKNHYPKGLRTKRS